MPRGTADDTRNRILAAADRLFYREGFSGVSIDHIAADAGVTKKTIYYHFSSKDALIAAYLEQRDGVTLAWLIGAAEKAGEEPTKQLIALFTALTQWGKSRAFGGCPFVRAASELARVPEHPALRIGAAHKSNYLAWMVGLAQRAGASAPELVGRQLLVLVDGAIAEVLVTADVEYFDAASKAAVALLSKSVDE